jgi:hypothetical protein
MGRADGEQLPELDVERAEAGQGVPQHCGLLVLELLALLVPLRAQRDGEAAVALLMCGLGRIACVQFPL